MLKLRDISIRAGVPDQCDEDRYDEWLELQMDAERAAADAQHSVHVNGHCPNIIADHLFKVTEPAATSRGGVYTEEDALALLNPRYFIGTSKQETAVFRLNTDGSATFVPEKQFKLEVQNISVQVSETKRIPAEKFWKESPYRNEKQIVFKPGGTSGPHEFNLWRDFGIVPRRTRRNIRSLLRHISKVLCRGDLTKFRYLIRWLAWAVQHPDKHPGTIIVLKSRKQGTGKSTLGVVMLEIFGAHGALIDDSDRLLGRFNDWIEPICFMLAEEILWAGNHRTTDKLKSRITADTVQIERKHGAILQIPNKLHIIMTTNHDHAVGAGVGDRRFVVLEADDKHACDRAWFDRIYRDLKNGGTGEFLDFLLNLQLGDWHPREILKTKETLEQQRMSGDSISQWSQACVDADAIIGNEFTQPPLGQRIAFDDLRKAYSGYCRQQGVRLPIR
jgi:hypothetical protein